MHNVLCSIWLCRSISREQRQRPAIVNDRDDRLVKLLGPLISKDGFTESVVRAVRLFRSDNYIPRRPVVYEPSIVTVAQGHKNIYLGDEACRCDPYNYLVLSVPLPLECKTVATPEEPVMGISISVDVATVQGC
jgi:hypothetical protein